MSEPQVSSPCVKACKFDPATGLCRGCLRAIEEIVRWGGADDAERLRILAAVAERRTATGEASGPAGSDPRGAPR